MNLATSHGDRRGASIRKSANGSNRLRERCAYIRDRQKNDPKWYLEAELSALTWAIDAIEALVAGTYQPPPVERGGDPNRPRPSALERWERRQGIAPPVEEVFSREPGEEG